MNGDSVGAAEFWKKFRFLHKLAAQGYLSLRLKPRKL